MDGGDQQHRVVHAGALEKRSAVKRSKWVKRWFVLYKDKTLKYFEDRSASMEVHKGTIDLHTVKTFGPCQDDGSRQHCFSITTNDRSWEVSARDQRILKTWLAYLHKMIIGNKVASGWLTKQGGLIKTWKRRYFELRDNMECKYYEDDTQKKCLGTIDLAGVEMIEPGQKGDKENTVRLHTAHRLWFLVADSKIDQQHWISLFDRAIGGGRRFVTYHEGEMMKQGGSVKTWKKRWFAISRSWMFYFESEEKCARFKEKVFFLPKLFETAFLQSVKGSINICGFENSTFKQAICEHIPDQTEAVGRLERMKSLSTKAPSSPKAGKEMTTYTSCFSVQAVSKSQRKYIISAGTDENRDRWIELIGQAANDQDALARAKKRREFKRAADGVGVDTGLMNTVKSLGNVLSAKGLQKYLAELSEAGISSFKKFEDLDEDKLLIIIQDFRGITDDDRDKFCQALSELTNPLEDAPDEADPEPSKLPRNTLEANVDAEIIGHAVSDVRAFQFLDQLQKQDGSFFLKHGKSGKPHRRKITIDYGAGRLMWETGALLLSDILVSEPDPSDYGKGFTGEIMGHGLVKGKKSDVFTRDTASESPDGCCFSIITDERTLDLEAPTHKERDRWVEGFHALLRRYMNQNAQYATGLNTG